MPEAYLADFTTLRLGGPARTLITVGTERELIDAVAAADAAGDPVLILSGGSNLVISDHGFAGVVIKVATRGVLPDVASDEASCGGAVVRVAAGEVWEGIVAQAVAERWVGIEALSGIPGAAGSTAIQNVGAYGQEVAQTIASVRTWDRHARKVRTFPAADCGFGYRQSRFKAEPDHYVVLSVDFQFRIGDLSAPIAYAELARTLGVEPGERAPLGEVRDAVLALRRGKGMVLDPADHDTWSAGSFFTNPLLSQDAAGSLPEAAPRWQQPDGTVKTSAAWLIEHAGFAKGYGLDLRGGRASLSTKHTLAMTNRGGASTADLLTLAREVRDGVEARFGVRLVNEPVLVGCEL